MAVTLTEFLVQVAVGGLGVAGGLLVFWLSQRSTREQRRRDDSSRAAGAILQAIADYHRLAIEPVAGTEWSMGSITIGPRSREDEGYRGLRVTAAIHLPQLDDGRARTDVRALLEAVSVTRYRGDFPPNMSSGDREELEGGRAERAFAAFVTAEESLVRFLEEAAAA